MKLSELIAAYGDDKVTFQKLDDDADSMNYHHKKGTKITFGTNALIDHNGTREMGLVVWLDRDRVAEIIETAKSNNEEDGGCPTE